VPFRNSCFCDSTVLALGKYTTISYDMKEECVRKLRRSSGKTDGKAWLLEMLKEVATVDLIINLQSSGWHFKSWLLWLDVLMLSAGVIHNSL
jgi:hypothetical protein